MTKIQPDFAVIGNAAVTCRGCLNRLEWRTFRCHAAVAFRQVQLGQERREQLRPWKSTPAGQARFVTASQAKLLGRGPRLPCR
jgi:hypothetical protein